MITLVVSFHRLGLSCILLLFLPWPQVELFNRFIAAVRVISKSIWVYADSKESPSNKPRGRSLRLSPLFSISYKKI